MEAGAAVDAKDDRQYTPLHFAALNGHTQVCRMLMKAGAAVDAKVDQQYRPLHSAASEGHVEVCRMLLEAGAAIDARHDKRNTPLLIAAKRGHTEMCRMLIEAGAAIDAWDDKRNTPLLIAANMGHTEMCRMLIEAGATIETRNAHLTTPLHFAASKGHAQICRMLVEAGAAIDAMDDRNTFTPLFYAAQNGHAGVCRVLVDGGAAVNARNDKRNSPLHLAANQGHVEVCCILTEAGAAVDARTDRRCTPIHRAALQGHDSTCILLTFKRAELTARAHGMFPAGDPAWVIAEMAQRNGHATLAAHLRNSNGAHCLRCTGPSLEPRLLWNDTPQQQQDAMLDEMQAQWLARVAENCAHARVGLTLRGAFGGGLSTGMLLHVMGYVFEGTQAHLQSCISTGRVAVAGGLATQMAVSVVEAVIGAAVAMVSEGAVPTAKMEKVGGTSSGQLMQEPVRLALVSHALVLGATPAPQPVSSSSTTVLSFGVRLQLQVVLARLVAAAEAAEGGCEWLCRYCDFLQRRHRLGL
jgi:ankyrin repeat protein